MVLEEKLIMNQEHMNKLLMTLLNQQLWIIIIFRQVLRMFIELRLNKYIKKNDLALQDFNKAIELNKTYDGVYAARGMFYYEINEDYKAIEDFTKVIEICSNDNKDYNDYYGYQERGWVYDKIKTV